MRVLVACEFSGVVRQAFRRRGHDAWSCDLLPSLYQKEGAEYHITGDVTALLRQSWDLVIAHPPCTYLTNTGSKWLARNPARLCLMEQGVTFFRLCLQANAPRVCVENPIPHARAVGAIGQKYTQVVQPWMFGSRLTKATALWLKGLPQLVPSVAKRPAQIKQHRSRGEVGDLPPSWFRPYLRSVLDHHLAEAMAEQWGGLCGTVSRSPEGESSCVLFS